jgi:hypothetical protein
VKNPVSDCSDHSSYSGALVSAMANRHSRPDVLVLPFAVFA